METLKRQARDLNNKNLNTSNNSNTSKQNSRSISSLTEKTKSLSMISNNHNYLTIKDIMAFYDQLDQKIFDDKFKLLYILSERNQFDDINQIENQRLLIEQNENCCIYKGMIIDNQQLIVLKELDFYEEDKLIKSLDEFKIHYKINNLFLQDSLLLITPVQVSKYKSSYRLKAALERAECNLYQYSRKNTTNDIQAFDIFQSILSQITNMHSIKIAHRDVKPQNIFYVADKGWVLSDFGESKEYEELESLYNVRGTMYFLKSQIQQQYKGSLKIKQNLLMNDLYALVVSIIVIQKNEFIKIPDIQQEINNFKDHYLIQALEIQKFQLLREFQQKISETKQDDIYYNFQVNYQNQKTFQQEKINQFLIYKSWINLSGYYAFRQIYPELTIQIVQLINDNIFQIFTNLQPDDAIKLKGLKVLKVKKQYVNQQYFFKNFSKLTIRELEIHLKLLSFSGFSETTMLQSQYILQHQYSQFIHLVLIDSLERLEMHFEAQQQFKIFQQGLVFEQLDTEYQQKILLKLQHYGQDQLQFDPGQKLDQLLALFQIEIANIAKFIQKFNYNFDNQNIQASLNQLKKFMQENCNIYSIQSIFILLEQQRTFYRITYIYISCQLK